MKSILKYFTVSSALIVLASCEDILEVPDISNERIELLAPKDSAIVMDNNVNFNWTEILEADDYAIQIATPNFQNAAQIVFDTVVRVDSTFVRAGMMKNLSNSDYEWRVMASNSGYATGYSSGVFKVDSAN